MKAHLSFLTYLFIMHVRVVRDSKVRHAHFFIMRIFSKQQLLYAIIVKFQKHNLEEIQEIS